MDTQNQDIEDLSSQISHLGWDEFHTLLTPIAPDDDLSSPSVVGQILPSRIFPSTVVSATLKAAWAFVKEFTTDEMEPNLFLVRFSKAEDKERVLAQTPWNIRGHLMVFKSWSSELTIPELDFYSEAMWLQVHGLPWNRIGESTL